jgi:uncharacterized RDD family membrane protein YckC
MSSALLDTAAYDLEAEQAAAAPAPHIALRLEVAERLAAHRSRRLRIELQPVAVDTNPDAAPDSRATRIAAAVAERYAQSQSYRAFLAAEAERALQQAQAAAEIAARNAAAIAAAQQQLLLELEAQRQAEYAAELQTQIKIQLQTQRQAEAEAARLALADPAPRLWTDSAEPPSQPRTLRQRSAAPARQSPAPGLVVRLDENAAAVAAPVPRPVLKTICSAAPQTADPAETAALDYEIAFRQSPVFDGPPTPAMPLPANLIEFPRQLVAPRKARPRHAEGPLREETDAAPGHNQLRIFEVEPDLISTTPPAPEETQWISLWLDAPKAQTAAHAVAEAHIADPQNDLPAETHAAVAPLPPETAPINHRIMASTVDGCLVAAGFLAFATTLALTAPASLDEASRATLAGGGIALVLLLQIAYQGLFFSLSQATPGMRYARIALCTLADENPTRAAMRRRILPRLAGALPLGLGLFAACFHPERLTWHDRISGTYQRSY